MPGRIAIHLGSIQLTGVLNETPAAKVLYDVLPVKIRLTRWGDEYYGPLLPPIGEFEDEGQEVMQVGDIAYWQPGEAFCIFFGPTPASQASEPRAASPVLFLGNVQGDWGEVKKLGRDVTAIIEAEDDF